MSSIFFKCPVCGCTDKETIIEEIFSAGEIVECPDCLNLLLVNNNYQLEDFKDILADKIEKQKASKKRPKTVGTWDDVNAISVRYL